MELAKDSDTPLAPLAPLSSMSEFRDPGPSKGISREFRAVLPAVLTRAVLLRGSPVVCRFFWPPLSQVIAVHVERPEDVRLPGARGGGLALERSKMQGANGIEFTHIHTHHNII